MNFEDITKDRIDLFDELLSELEKPQLFNNSIFEIDSRSTHPRYLRFSTFGEDREIISLIILIEYDSLRLDICGIPECFEWTEEDINLNRDEVKKFFKKLFTSYILFESCGSPFSKSRMYLFSKDGNLTEKYILQGFVHKFFGWNCDKHLFFPVF